VPRAEDVATMLTEARQPNWQEHLLAKVGRLPRELREPCRALLGHDARGKPLDNAEFDWDLEVAAAKQLDNLKKKERQQVFEALFPTLANEVEAGWRLKQRLPYQTGEDRKAFRAPSKPALSREARFAWLRRLLHEIGGYEQNLAWLATYAGHLGGGYGAVDLGIVLAAALDQEGPESDALFAILKATARGELPGARMGRHVLRALLATSRSSGWELAGTLLLADPPASNLAAILESMDEASPESFCRMLHLIRESDLAENPAVVQAMDVWFDFHWDAVSVSLVRRVLGQVLVYLKNPEARAHAQENEDAETIYLALWAQAFEDAVEAVKRATRLLKDDFVQRRFVGVHLLGQLELPAARKHLVKALNDPDLRVALHALEGLRNDPSDDTDLFEPLERLLRRLPATVTHLEPIVWPWHVLTASTQGLIAELVESLGDRSPLRLVRHLPVMESAWRARVAGLLADEREPDSATREALIDLAGDPSKAVREQALRGLGKVQFTEEAAQRLEQWLTHKDSDQRQDVLNLLLRQKDKAVMASAERLLRSADRPQRLGGLELLRWMVKGQRMTRACQRRARQYQQQQLHLIPDEEKHLGAILDED
jgi:HEAT repeat protein